MRAGVNVSAFYPTLERVLTEYADNSIAAILRMLAANGAILWGNLWVKYEGATLEIRDDGPGKLLKVQAPFLHLHSAAFTAGQAC